MSPLWVTFIGQRRKQWPHSKGDKNGRWGWGGGALSEGCIWICSDALEWASVALGPARRVIKWMTHLLSGIVVLSAAASRQVNKGGWGALPRLDACTGWGSAAGSTCWWEYRLLTPLRPPLAGWPSAGGSPAMSLVLFLPVEGRLCLLL